VATAETFLAAARSEIGYTESPAGSNQTKFAGEAGHANGQPWCATFLVAIANRVGLALPSRSAYTPTLAEGFKTARRWHTTPAVGDFVFFDWPGDDKRRIQHGAVVERVYPHDLVTIEGNTSADNYSSQDNGGGVFRRTRPRNSSIVGYGRPAYSGATPAPTQPEAEEMLTVITCREHGGVYLTDRATFVRTLTHDAVVHGRNLGWYTPDITDVPHSVIVWIDQAQDGHHNPEDV